MRFGFTLPGPPAACSTSAPMAAACGADALVPKKFGSVSSSSRASSKKNVVLAPSIAARSGFSRTSGLLSRRLFRLK